MNRTYCIFCNSLDLQTIVDLGIQPLADTFINKDKVWEDDAAYPLRCVMCMNCHGIQTGYITDPKERYCSNDYSYTSSNSKASRTYWDNYARELVDTYNLKDNDLILEVGSNDGYLLSKIREYSNVKIRVLGVDPSLYMYELAIQRKVGTINALFDSNIASALRNEYGGAKLIIANNVFNHSNDPIDFIRGINYMMDQDSTFICEAPYWLESIRSGRFDQIYHEHVFYFTGKSMKYLADAGDLEIIKTGEKDYHGGSLRCLFKKNAMGSTAIHAQIAIEEGYGLYKLDTYHEFMTKIYRQKERILKRLQEVKDRHKIIIAVGAAAKGNTLLNFYGLDGNTISRVTDSSIHKQGKWTPRTRIPICSDEIFSKIEDPYAIILSWNITDSLKEILRKINPNIEFIDL